MNLIIRLRPNARAAMAVSISLCSSVRHGRVIRRFRSGLTMHRRPSRKRAFEASGLRIIHHISEDLL
jgi:hypothetical protein